MTLLRGCFLVIALCRRAVGFPWIIHCTGCCVLCIIWCPQREMQVSTGWLHIQFLSRSSEENECGFWGDILPQASWPSQSQLSRDWIINKVWLQIAQITPRSPKKCRSHTIRNSVPKASCSFESNQFPAKIPREKGMFLFFFRYVEQP